MLHSLPALLEELDRTLLESEDPMPLIASVRWSEIVDWPKDAEQARAIKKKIARIREINNQVSFSARATIMALASDTPYKMKGGSELPAFFSSRIEASV